MLPPPSLLLGEGYERYSDWYPRQDEVVSKVMDWIPNGNRFFGLSLPTGSGKSLIGAVTIELSDKRAVILTSTKGLQAQIFGDFRELGIVDIRGQNSFMCPASEDAKLRCDEGPCHEGMPCSMKDSGDCPYYGRLASAKRSKIVVTNYHYWLAQNRWSDGIGSRDLLICDEFHLARTALEGHLAVYFGVAEIEQVGGWFPENGFETWDDWRGWASVTAGAAASRAADIKDMIQAKRSNGEKIPVSMSNAFRAATLLERKMVAIAEAMGEWVWENKGRGWLLTPTWVSPYAGLLYQEVDKVVVMSAVLTEKTMRIMAIPKDTSKLLEMPSYFPKENTPVQHVKTARIRHTSTPDDLDTWVRRIDQIIDRRLDRKGIVFTVSYNRRNFLMQRSRHSDIMVSHDTNSVKSAVDKFKKMDPPAVLISPAVTSGWDFPGESCEYIILGKVPYPDTSGPVMQARQKGDSEWSSLIAMETLVQSAGRGTRSATDTCEVLICDDNWGWFLQRYKHLAPKWFLDRVRRSSATVPDPPRRQE